MSLLEVNNVTKRFGGVTAVDRVSMGFEAGKVTALIGPNGAGKTTVFNLINGLISPDEGTVTYGGKSVSGLQPWEVARLGIGRLFQDVRIFSRMTALENVLVPLATNGDEAAWKSMLLPIRGRKRAAEHRERARELIEQVGLSGREGDLAGGLSFGQQKLLAIARLLAADSKVLLLDEPAAGLSASMIEGLLNVIRTIAAEGRTVIVIEHNMDVVSDFSDWVFFMKEGCLVEFGSPNDVLGGTNKIERSLCIIENNERLHDSKGFENSGET